MISNLSIINNPRKVEAAQKLGRMAITEAEVSPSKDFEAFCKDQSTRDQAQIFWTTVGEPAIFSHYSLNNSKGALIIGNGSQSATNSGNLKFTIHFLVALNVDLLRLFNDHVSSMRSQTTWSSKIFIRLHWESPTKWSNNFLKIENQFLKTRRNLNEK